MFSSKLPTDLFEGDTNSERFLAELQTNSKHTIPEQPYKCGIETNPTKKQYPWKASLSYNHLNSTRPICQAILISPSHLITPAHCVTSMKAGTAVPSDSLLVHLGKEDQVKLSDVVVHPGYQAGFLDHDLALLKTTAPLEVTDHVRPICLFESEVRERRDLAFLVGNEIGKGDTVAEENVEAAAFRIDRGECEQMNPKLKGVLGENTYCVSYLPDNEHCVGSSGDGLISSKEGRSILRGVVPLGLLLQGEKECKENSVSVVTDVAKYKKWIYRIIYQ
nr:coagulation factor VII-like [Leptinotarsa decemlineata]